MELLKNINTIIISLISIVLVLFPFYASFHNISLILLYISHLLYMIGFYIYLLKRPIDLESYARTYLINTGRNHIGKYVIKTIYSYYVYIHLYTVLLLLLTWSIIRGDFRTEILNLVLSTQHRSLLISCLINYVSINLFYTSILALIMILTNKLYAVLTVFLLETTGFIISNPFLAILIIYPEINIFSILVSLSTILLVFTTTYLGWEKCISKHI